MNSNNNKNPFWGPFLVGIGLLGLLILGLVALGSPNPFARQPASVAQQPVAPSQSAPVAQQPVAQQSMPDIYISAGETRLVPAGYSVSGDVVVGGKVEYDNDPSTGLIVVLTHDANVFAQWGASATSSKSTDSLKGAMLSVGCGNNKGCRSVTLVTR